MIGVAGEALVDLVIASDSSVTAHLGGAPYNAARGWPPWRTASPSSARCRLDRFGQALADRLVADGVDISAAARVDQPTTLAAAELDDDGSATYRFYAAGTSAPLFRSHVVDPALVDHFLTGGLALVVQPMADEVERLLDSLDGRTVLMLDVNCRPSVIDDRAARTSLASSVLLLDHTSSRPAPTTCGTSAPKPSRSPPARA